MRSDGKGGFPPPYLVKGVVKGWTTNRYTTGPVNRRERSRLSIRVAESLTSFKLGKEARYANGALTRGGPCQPQIKTTLRGLPDQWDFFRQW
ncbi:hypothetical protein NPIL_660061 [Nephila pilipes]|uniref:Uncharacterized protein n=1 Tax=Nephila pilipes TaxID=299642 RepID=A0A8X6MFK4_NEPPI|nr:hypothetical protein NPIL_660061 [Nephila pilipes]